MSESFAVTASPSPEAEPDTDTISAIAPAQWSCEEGYRGFLHDDDDASSRPCASPPLPPLISPHRDNTAWAADDEADKAIGLFLLPAVADEEEGLVPPADDAGTSRAVHSSIIQPIFQKTEYRRPTSSAGGRDEPRRRWCRYTPLLSSFAIAASPAI